VNQAFDRFTADYFHARGVYLSSGEPTAGFTAFTRARVNLLARGLNTILSPLPGSLDTIDDGPERGVNTVVDLRPFLNRVINGQAPPSSNSLLQRLNSASAVPPPGTRGAALTPYTQAAINAIQSARIATIHEIPSIIRAKPE
jgi:hypothetical protein